LAWNEVIDFAERHLLPCGIKTLTGFDCPGCGMQRAFIALLRGDLLLSLQLHPALPLYLITIIYTLLHLKFSFSNGNRIIMVFFLLSVSLMIVNFIVRLSLRQYL
jgi:hypothetical protein